MKYTLLIFICLYSVFTFADFSDYLKKDFGQKEATCPLRGIDYIYLINLDQRPEKWEACKKQLQPYGIMPHRFPAIYGWDLSAEEKNELGVKFSPSMLSDTWVVTFPKKLRGNSELDFLRQEIYGTSVFCHWMKPGAIGCYLSHLCVLQDAYDSGYKTIWVLEDDIVVEKDPHLLSSYIEKLDVLVGEYGWDILYTDMDFDADTYLQSAREFPHFFWRPDIDTSSNYQRFIERNPVGEDFLSIGSRSRAHSMIIRRSGMKKILDYAKEYHMFLPYDHDVAIVPGIKLFNLRNNIVTVSETVSDTNSGEFTKKTKWDEYRKNVIEESKSIPRWNSLDSSDKVMQLLYDIQPNTCVEIGCFGGATTYQIAKTLSFLKKGKLYAIDAWDVAAAVKKIKDNSLIETFKSLNWQSVQKGCETLIASKNLNTYCTLIQELSEQAASRFSDESIDFLYIDGNPSSEGSLTDVLTYLPKVKKGGYICLNGANTLEKTASIAHLLKYCFWLKEEFKDPRCLLFQKKQ